MAFDPDRHVPRPDPSFNPSERLGLPGFHPFTREGAFHKTRDPLMKSKPRAAEHGLFDVKTKTFIRSGYHAADYASFLTTSHDRGKTPQESR